MIEDHLAAGDPEHASGGKEDVGWVVQVEHGRAAEQRPERGRVQRERGDGVLEHEAAAAPTGCLAGSEAAHLDPADPFPARLALSTRGRDRDPMPGPDQRLRLGPDAHVLRVGIVLQQHDDSLARAVPGCGPCGVSR